jgi:beta-lactamase class A
LQRPAFLRLAASSVFASSAAFAATSSAFAATSSGEAIAAAPSPVDAIAAVERRVGGRLGVFAFDTAGGARIEHRAYEPFPMCSTFKLLAAAAVLARVDRGALSLDRRIAYGAGDLLEHSPDTKAHVAEGSMTLEALCAAAVEDSDNTAVNLLLRLLGGRDGFNGFVRSLGDRFTQLDRIEPALNEALPGDTRDCTTPSAMAKDAWKLVLGTALSAASRAKVTAWLVASTTGATRLRAGFPASWRIGDKTGTGLHGTSNDVAIVWPPNRAPIVIAAYLTGSPEDGDARDAALASVGKIVAAAFATRR